MCSDEALAAGVQHGNQADMQALVERYYEPLLHLSFWLSGGDQAQAVAATWQLSTMGAYCFTVNPLKDSTQYRVPGRQSSGGCYSQKGVLPEIVSCPASGSNRSKTTARPASLKAIGFLSYRQIIGHHVQNEVEGHGIIAGFNLSPILHRIPTRSSQEIHNCLISFMETDHGERI